jgi:hypothetical protein
LENFFSIIFLSIQPPLPLLGILFLDQLLKLFQFLAQLRERLLGGIGFLPPSLSGAEIGFFCSVFLKTMAIASIVHRVRAPMLLVQVAVFLGMYLLWESGTMVSTRSLCTLLFAVQSFLVARSMGFIGSFLVTYVLDSLERQKERAHVHRSTTFLVKVVLILPCIGIHSEKVT